MIDHLPHNQSGDADLFYAQVQQRLPWRRTRCTATMTRPTWHAKPILPAQLTPEARPFLFCLMYTNTHGIHCSRLPNAYEFGLLQKTRAPTFFAT